MLVIAGKSCFQQQKWQERESLPFQLLFAHLNPSMNVKQHCCSAHCFLLQLLIMYEYEDYKKLVFLSSYFLFITKLCKKKLKQVKCKHFQPLHTQNRAEGIGTQSSLLGPWYNGDGEQCLWDHLADTFPYKIHLHQNISVHTAIILHRSEGK